MMDYNFHDFHNKWSQTNLREDVRKYRDSLKEKFLEKYGCLEPPIDYNEDVVTLTDSFIEKQIRDIETSDFDSDYKEQYCNWIRTLRYRDFSLLYVGRKCVWVPELSSYFALDENDFEYVSRFENMPESYQLEKCYEKLEELMSPIAFKNFKSQIVRNKIV